MKIGLYIRLSGRPGAPEAAPTWATVREQALAAEAVGFDLVVLEDALMYPGDDGTDGVWEAVSMAAAVAAATSTIGIGHAVINSPYRAPALTAKVAATLDEIAGGRYTFGLGLGNTPDDYPAFGINADPRYSRFEEAIQIIHGLLRGQRVDFEGEYYRAKGAELVLRGPRPAPPIVIAAGKPRAMRLVARYADEWNWWTATREDHPRLRELVAEMERACEEVEREPGSLRRSLDVYSVAVPGVAALPADSDGLQISGTPEAIVEALLAYGELGFAEVRINLIVPPSTPRPDAIAWMKDVVSFAHAA